MKKLVFALLCILLISQSANSQSSLQKHNPLIDLNLSPTHNSKINPVANSIICPKYNWNLNPLHNDAMNPLKNKTINPLVNTEFNPNVCEILNPMFTNALYPKNSTWYGSFLFDKDDKLIGYVSIANQHVLLAFNAIGDWTYYYVRSSMDSYNEFTLDGKWTGRFLCSDSMEGYNLFSSDGEWTGQHIK